MSAHESHLSRVSSKNGRVQTNSTAHLHIFHGRSLAVGHQYTSLGTQPILCSSIPGLVPKQLRFCRNYLEIMPSVAEGVKIGIQECQHQFRGRRWNCTTINDNLAIFGPVLDKGNPHISHCVCPGTVKRHTSPCSHTDYIASVCVYLRVQVAGAHRVAAGGMNADNGLRWEAVSAAPIAFNKLSSNCYIDGEGLSPSGPLMMGGLLRAASKLRSFSQSSEKSTSHFRSFVTNAVTFAALLPLCARVNVCAADGCKLPLKPHPHLSISQRCLRLRLHQRSLIYINQSVKTRPTGIRDERRVSAATRESAFVHAIASAGVAFAVTRACSEGSVTICGCDTRRKGPPGEGWKWGGCSEDVEFGSMVSREFADARENRPDARSAMNRHNNEAGHHMYLKCKCHGLSGSCEVKTCWWSQPDFRVIGDYMKDKYDSASEMVVEKHRESRGWVETLRPKYTFFKPPTETDLVYYESSPNFCEPNPETGSFGTRDRICNLTSHGIDGCDLLCCGRGHNTRTEKRKEKCHCIFHWCCYVSCQECTRVYDVHTCK
ncbi:Protein Wnt-3a [Labeo rohita]|uniref:Protein Wnt n=1 Tax=Labeo rohita TaxID=84645 RepID=A0ABQ8MYH7_LABRO|nr:Protein Wnt-3a [Labeo rohita]